MLKKLLHNLFHLSSESETKVKNIRKVTHTIIELKLGEYISINLIPEICDQLLELNLERYDTEVLKKRCVKGIVKAVYRNDNTKFYYIELIGVVIPGHDAVSGTRKEYVILEQEIMSIQKHIPI